MKRMEEMEENSYEIIALNEHDYCIEDQGVRFFLLQGKDKALLIDSGMTTVDARQIVEQLTDKEILLVNTHADRDHIAGNGGFERFYMHPDEEENYRANKGTGELLPVREGYVFDLGERTLEVVEIFGHTPGSIGLIDNENKVLISGDPIQQGTIFMFGRFRDLAAYVQGLEHLQTYKSRFQEIWPSHGVLPIATEMIEYDKQCALAILNGEAEGEKMEVHGRMVTRYTFDLSAFYGEDKYENQIC